MIYQTYQAHADAMWPLRALATAAIPVLERRRTTRSGDRALRKIADEVSETLDYVPGRFKVIRHIREKL